MLSELIDGTRVHTDAQDHDFAFACRKRSTHEEVPTEGEEPLEEFRMVREGSEKVQWVAVHRADASREDFFDLGR